jgi:hypothetical protein
MRLVVERDGMRLAVEGWDEVGVEGWDEVDRVTFQNNMS